MTKSVRPIKLLVDAEIKALIPPLTEEECKGLEENIQREGCIDSVKIWKGKNIILDGHHRYAICTKYNIDFKTQEIDIRDITNAKIWVIRNQLQRRNVSRYEIIELSLKLGELIAEKAKRQQGRRTDLFPTSGKSFDPIDTEEKVAKLAGVSHNTVYEVKTILRSGDEEQKEKVRAGKRTIHEVFKEIKKREREETAKRELKDAAKGYRGTNDIQVWCGDFRELSLKIADESVNLILTDPPYGKQYLHLWDELGKVAQRVLKPGGFLVTYSGQAFLPEVLDSLRKHLKYFWTIALKHTGSTTIIDASNARNQWKPIIIFYKEPLKLPKVFMDMIEGEQGEKELHEWSQSVSESTKLLENFSKPNDLVVDPLCGSGTVLLAALQEKRKAIGIELNKEYVEIIKGRLKTETASDSTHLASDQ